MGLPGLTPPRPSETRTPPPSLNQQLDANRPVAPPTYVYAQREELGTPQREFWGTPEDNRGAGHRQDVAPEILGVSGYQDAPDPVRQSVFFGAGNKAHPHAWIIRPSHLALWKALISRDSYGTAPKRFIPWNVQQFSGMQLPSDIRSNIDEGTPTTYGSLYSVGAPPSPPGIGVPVMMPSGFVSTTTAAADGHPY